MEVDEQMVTCKTFLRDAEKFFNGQRDAGPSNQELVSAKLRKQRDVVGQSALAKAKYTISS